MMRAKTSPSRRSPAAQAAGDALQSRVEKAQQRRRAVSSRTAAICPDAATGADTAI
jgi:hypothetical protein